jgi:hypothetical protein
VGEANTDTFSFRSRGSGVWGMGTEQTEPVRRHRHRESLIDVQGAGLFRRRHEHGRWRLEPGDGIGFEEAVDEVRHRRKSVGAAPADRVHRSGAVVLNVPGNYQKAKFRGRLRQVPGGNLEFTGVMRETVGAVLLPLVFGFVTLVMLGLVVAGVLTGAWPPLVIGVVAAPLMGLFTFSFHRNRGRSYAADSHRLYGDLAKLLAPLHPHPLDAGTPDLDGRY